MTKGSAEFLKPLLKILGFNDITISESIPNNVINLSSFRMLRLNLTSGNLKTHYYELYKEYLPKDFSRNYFHFMERNLYPELNDKILLIHTSRYNNAFIDLKQLKKYQEKLLFIGLESEYEAFQKEFFELDYLPTDNDATEVAYCMLSAKGVIGNQSGLFALAETLKVPRILLTAEFNVIQNRLCIGPCNVECTGGWYEYVRTQQKLSPAIENLINKGANI